MAMKGLSTKEKIKDIFTKDEKGRHKNEWWLLWGSIVGLILCVYLGFVYGKKAGANPKYTLFEVFYNIKASDFIPFAHWSAPMNPGYLWVFLIIFLFIDTYAFMRIDRYKRKSDNSKGNAEWNDLRIYNPQFVYPKGASKPSEPDEFNDNAPGNMILAKDLYFNIKPNTMVYCNVAVVGTTGTGKTFGYVKPNLLQFNCSYVLTDPSGELVHDTGKALMDHGYAVKVFNTAEMVYSARYNPFKYIRTDQDIKTMISVFMANTDDSESGKGDQFFTKAEEVFYLAICYYIRAYYGDNFPDGIEKMNFNTVFEMFLLAQASEENEALVSGFDQAFLDFAEMPVEQRDKDGNIIYKKDENGHILYKCDENGNPKLDWKKRPIPDPEPVYELDENGNPRIDAATNKKITKKKYANSPALKYYKIFKQGSGKTLKSILISAGVRLGFLAIEEVAKLLSDDDLELETMGDRRQALFAIIKAEDSTYNFISAMMFTQLFESLYYEAGQRNPYSWLLTKGKCTALKSRRWRTTKECEKLKEELLAEQARYKDGAYIVGEEEEDPDRFMQEDENGILPWPRWKIVSKDYEWDNDAKQPAKGEILHIFNGKKEAEVFLDTVLNGKVEKGTKVLTCHVRFILDEFANIGIIPEFDKKLATFRKYNISSDIILQSIDQLRKMYDDNIGLILANCNIMVLLGTTDKEDSEFFSELTGQKTVETVSHSLDMKGFTGVSGGNMSVDAENLMRPEDIRTMDPHECLVIVNTQQPFKLKKYPAIEHPNYHELYDDHIPEQMDNEFEFKRIFNTSQYEYVAPAVDISMPAPAKPARRGLSSAGARSGGMGTRSSARVNELRGKKEEVENKLAALDAVQAARQKKDEQRREAEPPRGRRSREDRHYTPRKGVVEQPPEMAEKVEEKFKTLSGDEKKRLLEGIKKSGAGTGSEKTLYVTDDGGIADVLGSFLS
jgi:type IV secretory pathway TraG/TraD family ATPase VirD4